MSSSRQNNYREIEKFGDQCLDSSKQGCFRLDILFVKGPFTHPESGSGVSLLKNALSQLPTLGNVIMTKIQYARSVSFSHSLMSRWASTSRILDPPERRLLFPSRIYHSASFLNSFDPCIHAQSNKNIRKERIQCTTISRKR